jgi:hypothetical protein
MTSAADWTTFATVVGTAASALTGLLFVAVSVNAQAIAARPALRASAAQTLVLFGSSLVIGIVLVIPDQDAWVVGAELVALGALTGAAMAVIGRGKTVDPHDETARLARLVDRASPNMVTSVLIVVAGVSQLAGVGGGLYWLVPAAVLALIGGVINTWWFLTRLPS